MESKGETAERRVEKLTELPNSRLFPIVCDEFPHDESFYQDSYQQQPGQPPPWIGKQFYWNKCQQKGQRNGYDNRKQGFAVKDPWRDVAQDPGPGVDGKCETCVDEAEGHHYENKEPLRYFQALQ